MIEINLLPWREQARTFKKKRFMFEAGIALLCVLFIIILFHLYFDSQISNKQRLLDYLQSQINQQQSLLNNMGDQEHQETGIKTELDMMKKIYLNNNNTINLLNSLIDLVPPHLSITKIVKQNNIIMISGVASTPDDITQFMQAMDKSPYFKEPVLSAINQESSSGNRFFEISLKPKE